MDPPGSTLQRHTSRCASARALLLAPPWTRSRSHFLCGLKFPNYQFSGMSCKFQGGYLFIYIYNIYIYIPGAPKKTSNFWRFDNPSKQGLLNSQVISYSGHQQENTTRIIAASISQVANKHLESIHAFQTAVALRSKHGPRQLLSSSAKPRGFHRFHDGNSIAMPSTKRGLGWAAGFVFVPCWAGKMDVLVSYKPE